MSVPSRTLLTLPATAASYTALQSARRGAARRTFVVITVRPGSGFRGETTLHWEFVDSHLFKHDPAHLVSLEELGFDDDFADLYAREHENAASSVLAGLERLLGSRVYHHALMAGKRPSPKLSGQE